MDRGIFHDLFLFFSFHYAITLLHLPIIAQNLGLNHWAEKVKKRCWFVVFVGAAVVRR
ncbi:hypothetical protein K457DRAFT_27202 [Linnemannia elongata AG-77]|uniref:Uncharacterized protein n=1 Tax=Linnemannia elongata AG-77 TaxID=1314771 RepID=A0A197KGC2_9FUNG|nr:hypothetical protein K457DRAFT_27202 [Linnemannia elongata AG-77]